MEETQVTRILRRMESGERQAAEELLPLVYNELRRVAQGAMAREDKDHTLQATALVHEVFLRLFADQNVEWNGRAHFYHAAARAMRQLLIEHARKKGTKKRGGDGACGRPGRIPLDVVDLAAEADPADILALDEAVTTLESEDPQVADVVRLRFFAGLTGEQTAQALGVSARHVDRTWAYARAVLFQHLRARGADN